MEVLFLVLKIIGIILLLTFLLLIWCCCRMSALSTRRDEELHMDEKLHTENRSDILFDNLSDLEMQTVEKLKKLIKPDKLSDVTLFEINKNENMTVGECLDNYYEYDGRVLLCDGKVLGVSIR